MIEADFASLIARWPGCGRMQSVQQVTAGGFSGAGVFRIQTEIGDFALRQWPDESLPTDRIRELHRFLRFLQQSGIEFVAVPRAADSGDTIVSFHGSRWQLEPWMPGTAIARHPSPTLLANVMHALARLHVAAAQYEPTEAGREWFFHDEARASPAVIERLQLIRDFGEDRVRVVAACGDLQFNLSETLQLYVRTAPTIARELESCAALKIRLQPCLRDLHREHVLVGGAEVTGIIDPSATRSESVASDLSRLLGSLPGSGPWEQALSAYSEVRPLSEDERRLVWVLDRSGVLLSALTWMQRVAEGLRVSPRVLQRVNEIHQRLESLAESIEGL